MGVVAPGEKKREKTKISAWMKHVYRIKIYDMTNNYK